MKRLDTEKALHFKGRKINRAHPIKGLVHDCPIEGFEGDTLFTATLASGFDRILIPEEPRPAIRTRLLGQDAQTLIPISEVPFAHKMVVKDNRLVSARGRNSASLLQRFFNKQNPIPKFNSLTSDEQAVQEYLFFKNASKTHITADFIVVGGGLSGLVLAQQLSELGQQVCVVEKADTLGGIGRYFGGKIGQLGADKFIDRLIDKIDRNPNIRIETQCVAKLILGSSTLFGMKFEFEHNQLSQRLFEFHAKKILLATGCLQKLPQFDKKSMQGVSQSLEMFELADDYSLIPEGQVTFFTDNDATYNFARKLADEGVDIDRIIDARLDISTNAAEHCKAMGVAFTTGAYVSSFQSSQDTEKLKINVQPVMEEAQAHQSSFYADKLIFCGGFSPNLDLWRMGGGAFRFDEQTGALISKDGPENLALCGSAAGHNEHEACIEHAQWLAKRLCQPEKTYLPPPIDENIGAQTVQSAYGLRPTKSRPDTVFPESQTLDKEMEKPPGGLLPSPITIGTLAQSFDISEAETCTSVLGLDELERLENGVELSGETNALQLETNFTRISVTGIGAIDVLKCLLKVDVWNNAERHFFSWNVKPWRESGTITVYAHVIDASEVSLWVPDTQATMLLHLLQHTLKAHKLSKNIVIRQQAEQYFKLTLLGDMLCERVYERAMDGQNWNALKTHHANILANTGGIISKSSHNDFQCAKIWGHSSNGLNWLRKVKQPLHELNARLITQKFNPSDSVQNNPDLRAVEMTQNGNFKTTKLRLTNMDVRAYPGLLLYTTHQSLENPTSPEFSAGMLVAPTSSSGQISFAHVKKQVQSGDTLNGLIGGKNYKFLVE